MTIRTPRSSPTYRKAPIARALATLRSTEGDLAYLFDTDAISELLRPAAIAIHHDLELVTGNVRRFERIEGLRLERVLAEARG
jgi:hypothetical protein